jgi:hypothetical protein
MTGNQTPPTETFALIRARRPISGQVDRNGDGSTSPESALFVFFVLGRSEQGLSHGRVIGSEGERPAHCSTLAKDIDDSRSLGVHLGTHSSRASFGVFTDGCQEMTGASPGVWKFEDVDVFGTETWLPHHPRPRNEGLRLRLPVILIRPLDPDPPAPDLRSRCPVSGRRQCSSLGP